MGLIKFIQQPSEDTCTSACIAMLLNCDVNKVIKEFHEDYMNDRITAAAYLKKNGILLREFMSSTRQLLNKCVYLLCVPSLQTEGLLHSILLDTTDEDNFIVYDPMMGVGLNKYYVYKECLDIMSVPLRGYVMDCEVVFAAPIGLI